MRITRCAGPHQVTIGIDLAGRRIVHYDDDNPMPKLDDGPR